ncbi:MAG: tetratricopeptide repeat protein, partial [Holophagales bacterium]|nr:tetratricopeptide repeat protein [Holophagales bacterium]
MCTHRIDTARRVRPSDPRLPRPHRAAPRRRAAARPAGPVVLGLLAALVLPSSAPAQDPAAERLLAEAERRMRGGEARAALAEFDLLVRQFPNDSLAPKVLLRMAEVHRLMGDDGAAERALQRLLDSHPRTPEAASGFL